MPSIETNVEDEKLLPLLERFKTLESILSENAYIRDTTKRLTRILDDADSKTQILLLGKERVGKTSVINALLGRELLPAAVDAPTEVNTFIKYAEEERVEAVFFDGYVATFTLNKVGLLASDPTTIAEIIREHIDYIVIYIKHDLLKKVSLIDTRAVELVEHQTPYFSEIILNRVDEILWVLRADSPATEDELTLLRKISLRHSKPYVLVNAIDEMGSNVSNFITSERNRYGEYVEDIIGISAKQAILARKTNNTQNLIDSRYTELTQLIQKIAQSNEKKSANTISQLEDWLLRLRKEIEMIPTREPYISAMEQVQKHLAEAKLDYSRQERDLAIVKTYESDYQQTAQIFKPVQTLYQLLKLISQELYLRDEMTEFFEELAVNYQQQVRAYRNLHSDYEAEFAQLQKNLKRQERSGATLEVVINPKVNALPLQDRIGLLNNKQQQLLYILDEIKTYEAQLVEHLYGIQNHLMALAAKRLKHILLQVSELNSQRNQEFSSIQSYSDKLEEFSCIIQAQQFLTNAIKPYFEQHQEFIPQEQKQLILNTIELIAAFDLDHTKIQPMIEQDETLTMPILVNFEQKYKLHALRLTESDVLSVIPELPPVIVVA